MWLAFSGTRRAALALELFRVDAPGLTGYLIGKAYIGSLLDAE